MYKLLTKNGQLFAFLLGVLGTVIVLASIMTSSNKGLLDMDDAAKRSGEIASTGILDASTSITMILLIVAVAAVLIFGLLQLVTNIKGSLTWIVAIIAVFGIFMIFKSTSMHESAGGIVETMKKFDVSENLSKGISGSIKLTGLLFILAIGSMLVMELLNLFK